MSLAIWCVFSSFLLGRSMKSTYLAVKGLKVAKESMIAEAGYLLNLQGTPWAFVGAAAMIDYCSRLQNGGHTDRWKYIGFIRKYFPSKYRAFEYRRKHRRKSMTATGIVVSNSKTDLPEQMYYILRCGLVHAYSLVPSATERNNGGRTRSIWLIHRASKTQNHLTNFELRPYVTDAAYFVAEDFIADLQTAIRALFKDISVRENIRTALTKQPPIWPLDTN